MADGCLAGLFRCDRAFAVLRPAARSAVAVPSLRGGSHPALEGLRRLPRAGLGEGDGRGEMAGVPAELVLVCPETRPAQPACGPRLASRGVRRAADGRGGDAVWLALEDGLVGTAV